ncbi:hypothetical protein V2W45_1364058, partial [Cenococcum geophilum]
SDNDSDSDNHTTCDTLPTRKRKRPLLAYTVSRKQYSRKLNIASKQHSGRAAHSIRRQKPSLLRSRP